MKDLIGRIVKVVLPSGEIVCGELCYENGCFRIPNYWQYELKAENIIQA